MGCRSTSEASKIRSERVAATVYQKHRTVQSREDDVYGLTLARCWKVKARGHSRKRRSSELKPQ